MDDGGDEPGGRDRRGDPADQRRAVRRAYDDLAETYAAERADELPDGDRLDDVLDEVSGGRVLDAGCGQGTPALARMAGRARAVGLDFSREQLRLASDNAPRAAVVQGGMTRLPFRSNSFDAVTAYNSLIHVPLDEHPTVVEEFARVLDGGWLVLSEGLTEWVGHNPDWLDTGVEMRWEIAGQDATREQLREAGFEVRDEWGASDSLEDDDDVAFPCFLARLEP